MLRCQVNSMHKFSPILIAFERIEQVTKILRKLSGQVATCLLNDDGIIPSTYDNIIGYF